MIGDRQKELLKYAQENDGITTQQAINLIGGTYYHGGERYTSQVLGRLVKRGFLRRVKRGEYKLGTLSGEKQQIEDPNQIKLL